jgi:hypothetical protein
MEEWGRLVYWVIGLLVVLVDWVIGLEGLGGLDGFLSSWKAL